LDDTGIRDIADVMSSEKPLYGEGEDEFMMSSENIKQSPSKKSHSEKKSE
jgi:hypothetical protein